MKTTLVFSALAGNVSPVPKSSSSSSVEAMDEIKGGNSLIPYLEINQSTKENAITMVTSRYPPLSLIQNLLSLAWYQKVAASPCAAEGGSICSQPEFLFGFLLLSMTSVIFLSPHKASIVSSEQLMFFSFSAKVE